MKYLGSFFLFAATILAPTSQARAQDFTGARVEVSAGYDLLESDGSFEDLPSTFEGVHARVAVGYDAAVFTNIIVGIEASVGGTRDAGAQVKLGSDSFAFSPERDLDVLARIGYRVGSGTLLYLKAGWANAGIGLVERGPIGDGQVEVFKSIDRNDGVRLAGGVERVLTGRVYGKVEYRFTDFGDGHAYHPRTERHQLLVGAGVRF